MIHLFRNLAIRGNDMAASLRTEFAFNATETAELALQVRQIEHHGASAAK